MIIKMKKKSSEKLHRKVRRCNHACNITGEYLALTGGRLSGKEIVAAGLATHFVLSEV